MSVAWVSAHWLVLPVLVPLVAAFATLLLRDRDPAWRRGVSVAASVALLLVAMVLVWRSHAGGHLVYRLGDWPVPVAIVLVLDRLSALMVLLTAVVAVAGVLHAAHGSDEEGLDFHPLVQLQLAGLCGAFLTGDLFNLFVFFEILLIASYCLLVFGTREARLTSGLHYVVLNLVGSSLFLVAIGALYGVTGTLNMAHLAERVALLGAADAGLVRGAALLLLVVFALKAALAPLYLWLPNAYAAATPAVSAIFALMTKVGVYAIVRTATLLFGPASGVAALTIEPWLLPLALASIIVGALGVLGEGDVRRAQGYLLVASVGTMLASASTFTEAGVSAALYYMLHSTVATAAMFLVVGATLERPGEKAWNGTLFFVGAVALAGVPPLSGFVGKALVLQATPSGAWGTATWGAILASSTCAVIALGRAGIALFWVEAPEVARERAGAAHADDEALRERQPRWTAAVLLVLLAAFTAWSGPASTFTARTAEQLLRPGDYVRTVLDTPGGR